MKTQGRKNVVVALIVALGFVVAPGSRAADAAETVWIEGTLRLAWATPIAGDPAPSLVAASLFDGSGTRLDLELSHQMLSTMGGPMAVNGRRVRVLIPAGRSNPFEIFVPIAIENMGDEPSELELASGSYPYISLMCAFSNIPLPSEGLPYFEGMYANTWPGLDHYWRRQSYGMVDVVGSAAAGWFTLPHTQAYYEGLINGSSYSVMLNALYDDCTGVASGSVNLGNYVGINLMFNETFGPYAWGGWGGVTWEPPWGWRNVAVIGHEMGHAFGLPHSNNADGDTSPYDNPWDVMSNSWGYAMSDGTYGTVGKHTITYHKDSLGWIPAARQAEVSSPGLYEFDIDHLTLATTTNLHMVKVLIPGSYRFYTIEVRDRVGYDGNLPGFAVILHEVDYGRQEPAWLIDIEDTSNGADAGAMWIPGECFDDPANEIIICVESVTTEGFTVRVGYGDWPEIFDDRFESGSIGAWGTSRP